MAYYNNNGYRNNNGYKKNYNNRYNNNGFNNGYRPQNDNRPVNNNGFDNGYISQNDENIEFDARKYKKKDIKIADMNGKIYAISGNFSTAMYAEIVKAMEQIKKITNNNVSEDNIAKYPEIYTLLKDWCLALININTSGEKYSMDDVDAGFNDVYILYDLLQFMMNEMSKRTNNNAE